MVGVMIMSPAFYQHDGDDECTEFDVASDVIDASRNIVPSPHSRIFAQALYYSKAPPARLKGFYMLIFHLVRSIARNAFIELISP